VSLGYVLRTPLSARQDWTLAITWDKEDGHVQAFLHGALPDERSMMLDLLNDSKPELLHPMFLPVLICEMLTDADANNIRSNALNLSNIELRTNFSAALETFIINAGLQKLTGY
jgi:hypothetical protein